MLWGLGTLICRSLGCGSFLRRLPGPEVPRPIGWTVQNASCTALPQCFRQAHRGEAGLALALVCSGEWGQGGRVAAETPWHGRQRGQLAGMAGAECSMQLLRARPRGDPGPPEHQLTKQPCALNQAGSLHGLQIIPGSVDTAEGTTGKAGWTRQGGGHQWIPYSGAVGSRLHSMASQARALLSPSHIPEGKWGAKRISTCCHPCMDLEPVTLPTLSSGTSGVRNVAHHILPLPKSESISVRVLCVRTKEAWLC